jgi:hypothetical protein
MNWMQAFWNAVVVQSLGQKRYREECEAPENVQVWYLSKWFVHAATMWGFLGLLFATVLDYLLDIVGVKATGTPVPVWYPSRLIGTAGLLLWSQSWCIGVGGQPIKRMVSRVPQIGSS